MFTTKEAALNAIGRGTGFGADELADHLLIATGADTPSNTSTVPAFIGQIYIDTANSKVYIGKATFAASDFLILN